MLCSPCLCIFIVNKQQFATFGRARLVSMPECDLDPSPEFLVGISSAPVPWKIYFTLFFRSWATCLSICLCRNSVTFQSSSAITFPQLILFCKPVLQASPEHELKKNLLWGLHFFCIFGKSGINEATDLAVSQLLGSAIAIISAHVPG